MIGSVPMDDDRMTWAALLVAIIALAGLLAVVLAEGMGWLA